MAHAKAAPVRRGHKHPHGKKKHLRNGHDVGEAGFARSQVPRHCRMFMAHLHRWALAFLGFWVGGSLVSAAESAPRQLGSLPNGIASLQGPSEACARARCRAIAPLIVV